MTSDRKRLNIAVTRDHDDQLRQAATTHRTTPGMIARALVVHGLAQLDTQDVQAAIEQELTLERQRRVRVGTAAMAARWGKGVS